MAADRFEYNDLKRILRDCAGEDPEDAFEMTVLDATFDELGYDSVTLMETLARITREYRVTIEDDAVTGDTTPRTLINLVNAS
jgi:act minimal PKS acyl carrier protein